MPVIIDRPTTIAAATLALLLASAAAAQDTTATLRGRVTDAASKHAIARAEIILISNGRSVQTDSAGDYVFAGLPLGTVELIVRAEHFPVRHMLVELAGGEVLDGSIALDSTAAGRQVAQNLPPVKVSATTKVSYRLLDFERRRQTGRGQYLTDAEIRSSGASNLQDAVRDMRGVLLDCGGSMYGGCRVRMSRAPERCLPEYIVDGQVDNDFGPTTPIRDIVGIEVYQGASDIPGEFAGSGAGCGVIVIWTRSEPNQPTVKRDSGAPPGR